MLLPLCPVQWCSSCPAHPITVLIGTAIMSRTVLCQVRGVMRCVSVCAVRVVGYPLSTPPPHGGGGGGYHGWVVRVLWWVAL